MPPGGDGPVPRRLAGQSPAGRRRSADVDALFRAVEQLQGAAVPASALRPGVPAARLPGYRPGLLDQLCASPARSSGPGRVRSALTTAWGRPVPGRHRPAAAPRTRPWSSCRPLATQVRDAVAARGAMFFRQLSRDAVGSTNDSELPPLPCGRTRTGPATSPTTPLTHRFCRALVAGGSRPTTCRRCLPAAKRPPRRPLSSSRAGPPAAAGRWSLVPTTA